MSFGEHINLQKCVVLNKKKLARNKPKIRHAFIIDAKSPHHGLEAGNPRKFATFNVLLFKI